MDKELKAKWVDALRSGDYVQGRTYLRDNESRFCCLGVLTDIDPANQWKERDENWDGYESNYGEAVSLSSEQLNRYGLADDHQLHCIKMNDSEGKSFNEIADWIEENL